MSNEMNQTTAERGASGANSAESANGANAESFGADGAQSAKETKSAEKTFSQSDVDRIVSERLRREGEKWERELEDKVSNRLSEAQKMAKMNKDEKAEYELSQREAALTKREAEAARKELMLEAKDILSSRALPIELSSVLDYSDADKCKSSIDSVEKVFRESVQKAVDEKIRDSKGTPKTGEGKTKDPFLEGMGL